MHTILAFSLSHVSLPLYNHLHPMLWLKKMIEGRRNLMSTTLRWLIESSSLENLHGVACSDKLDTPISSVNVLDNLDVVKWIKPNELVLSSGYLFMDDESLQRQLVQELHQVGCSALGIKTRRFFQTIPEAMLQEAERVGLPLLELPFFYSFSDISRVVFQRLFLQSSYRVRSEQRLLMALSNALFSGAGLSHMLQCLVQQYRTSVLLLSRSGTCLDAAYTSGTELRGMERFRPFAMPVSGETISLSCAGRQHLFFCVTLPGGYGGLFFLEDPANSLRGALTTLQHAAVLISLKLEQTRLQRLSSGECEGGFLSLLTDAAEDLADEEILHICHLHHFDYQKKRLCIALFPKDAAFSDPSALSAPLQTAAEALCRSTGPVQSHFLCMDARQCCLFLLCDASVSNPELLAQARVLIRSFQDQLGEGAFTQLRIGVGHCHQSVSSIPHALKECADVVHLMLPVFPDRNVFFASTNTIYHLLNQLPPAELRRIYLNTIVGLSEYDRANGTEFLKTLEAFYAHQFNASQAAKELYVHRNTLLHRMEKIKELLHCDFKDTNDLMTIYLGICVAEMLG